MAVRMRLLAEHFASSREDLCHAGLGTCCPWVAGASGVAFHNEVWAVWWVLQPSDICGLPVPLPGTDCQQSRGLDRVEGQNTLPG